MAAVTALSIHSQHSEMKRPYGSIVGDEVFLILLLFVPVADEVSRFASDHRQAEIAGGCQHRGGQ